MADFVQDAKNEMTRVYDIKKVQHVLQPTLRSLQSQKFQFACNKKMTNSILNIAVQALVHVHKHISTRILQPVYLNSVPVDSIFFLTKRLRIS